MDSSSGSADARIPDHGLSNPLVLRTAVRQYGLITWEQAQEAGVSASDIRRYRRAQRWGKPFPRVYSIRPLLDDNDPVRRLHTRVMAAQLALGPDSFAGGETASLLWQMQGLPRWDGSTIHMVIPALGAQRHVPGVVLHTWDTSSEDITAIGSGIRLTTPGRTLRDTLLLTNRETAVCLMDSALNQGLIHTEDIEHLEWANRGRRGCARARQWWPLADGRAGSALETRVRLICSDGGFPPSELQHPFRDGNGELIGVVDFWWEGLRVIGEADGIGPHSKPEALARDRSRQNALQAHHPDVGIVRFTWQDLRRPEYILAAVAQAGDIRQRR